MEKKEEIAEVLLCNTINIKDYWELRVFIPKETILSDLRERKFLDYYFCSMPYYLEKDEGIKQVAKKYCGKSWYHPNTTDTLSAAYSLTVPPIDDCDLKEPRRDVRQELNYKHNIQEVYPLLAGLIRWKDKIAAGYPTNSDFQSYLSYAEFFIPKAMACETPGKRNPTMHLYL